MNLENTIEIIKKEINGYCTETISFRLFTRSDTFPLYDATLNPDFNKKLAWGPPSCFEDVLSQTEKLLEDMNNSQAAVISMTEKHTGAWCGVIKFSIYKDSVIQSLWFHPNYWNKPIIIFGSSAAIDIIFKATGLRKLYAKYILGHNTTKKILKKNGFVYIENDPIEHTDGRLIDCEAYELSYENWQGKSKTKLLQY